MSPPLQWIQPPRLGLFAEASVVGEVNRVSVDTERAAGGGFRRCPTAPSVIDYLGAPDVQVPSPQAGAKDQTRPWRRSEGQPPSSRGA
jgi:hypothetical protein